MTRKIFPPALQQRDFRLLWLGQLFSMVGSQMQLIGVNWHVYKLLRGQSLLLSVGSWHLALNMQAIGLGTLGAVRILPIFLFAFLGGAVADHWNRRQIILWSQVVACLCAGILGILTLGGNITLPLLYLFTALDAGISAFNEPAQTALFPQLVPREELVNATTLFTVARKYNNVMQAVANVCESAHLTHKAETWSLMDRMNTELQIVSNH